MKKIIRLTIVLILFITVLYNVWDNNRVIVVNQDVAIKSLPASFEGYKILVISDLHSKQFGIHQKNLIGKINKLDYDAIFIAGDMQDNDTEGYLPFLDLLHGLLRKTPVFYTAGTWGPDDYNKTTGEILSAGKVLQSEEVTLLNYPVKIERNGEQIWFFSNYSYSQNEINLNIASKAMANSGNSMEYQNAQKMYEYQSKLQQEIQSIPQGDVIIGLVHEPFLKDALENLNDTLPYSLIIAGHYHGGQIRLPLIGAIYVPAYNSIKDSYFPDNKFISGLYLGKKTQQYISRGLGASGYIPFLKFRLFNTPEINLLTLKSP